MEMINTDTTSKKSYYLIDYENVNKSGFNGIELLTENDCIVVFYTQNANTIPFDLHFKLAQTRASLQLINAAAGGKNALDFQLSTYLGFLVGSQIASDIHIISNDKGFENLRTFWKQQGVIISITSDIEGNKNTPTPVIQGAESEFDKAIKPLKLDKSSKDKLQKIMNEGLKIKDIPKRKQKISSEICKAFGNSKTKKYYATVKPLIK
ncbi:MAG: hypothetical protein IKP78_07465 [Ruminococcus sp.]|nr:hypothetical protein [Ruminococcus sp.]